MVYAIRPDAFSVQASGPPKPKARPRFGSTDIKPSLADPITGEVRDFYALTMLFRDDYFLKLAEVIRDRFPNGVPIHCYAASDGSEPYTLAMTLLDRAGPEKAKNYPIRAFDINPGLIEQAKKAILKVFQCDLAQYANYRKLGMNVSFLDLFERQSLPPGETAELEKTNRMPRKTMGPEVGYYKAMPPLRDMVTFETADIRQDARRKLEKPIVLVFRNAWYQLGTNRTQASLELAENLFNSLPSGSLLVIGESENRDDSFRVDPLLRLAGFRNIEVGAMKSASELCTSALVFERP
jgi:chemotaxis methyl-accepting protein methylase